jgi:hypothetical protein
LNRFASLACISPGVLLRTGVLCVCIAGLTGFGTVASQTITQKKRTLTEQLDSLDLEKQLRKRKGLSLDELEKAAEQIKDSIALLRKQLASGDEGDVEAADRSENPGEVPQTGFLKDFQRFLPKNVFDWVIVAVGGVAIISGIVLIFGLFGMLSKRFSRKRPPRTLNEMFPQAQGGDAAQGIPKVPQGYAELNNKQAETIRKRIQETASNDNDVTGSAGNAAGAAAAYSGTPSRSAPAAPDDDRNPRDVKNQVVEAARQGLDVQEISRRFHLSADEVSLILRMARQGGDKP